MAKIVCNGIEIAMKSPRMRSLSILAKSSSATEILQPGSYTGLKETTDSRTRTVAVEIGGLLSLKASSLAIGTKIT